MGEADGEAGGQWGNKMQRQTMSLCTTKSLINFRYSVALSLSLSLFRYGYKYTHSFTLYTQHVITTDFTIYYIIANSTCVYRRKLYTPDSTHNQNYVAALNGISAGKRERKWAKDWTRTWGKETPHKKENINTFIFLICSWMVSSQEDLSSKSNWLLCTTRHSTRYSLWLVIFGLMRCMAGMWSVVRVLAHQTIGGYNQRSSICDCHLSVSGSVDLSQAVAFSFLYSWNRTTLPCYTCLSITLSLSPPPQHRTCFHIVPSSFRRIQIKANNFMKMRMNYFAIFFSFYLFHSSLFFFSPSTPSTVEFVFM